MIERINISSLFGRNLTVREPRRSDGKIGDEAFRHDHLMLIDKDNTRIIGTVDREGLFDADGNYFYDDA